MTHVRISVQYFSIHAFSFTSETAGKMANDHQNSLQFTAYLKPKIDQWIINEAKIPPTLALLAHFLPNLNYAATGLIIGIWNLNLCWQMRHGMHSYLVHSIHGRVMQSVMSIYTCIYIRVCVCRKKSGAHLAYSRSKNPRKSAHEAFFSHLDIMNVTLNHRFTPDRALLLFLCLRLCAPLGGLPPVHTHTCSLRLLDVLWRLPHTMLTWRASDDYSVLLAFEAKQVFH